MAVMVFSLNFIVGVRFGDLATAWLPRSPTFHVKLVCNPNYHFCSPVVINFCIGKVFSIFGIIIVNSNKYNR